MLAPESSLVQKQPIRSSQIDLEGHPLVGVISTMYTDPEAQAVRYGLALQTAEAYRRVGAPLVAVDASPESWAGDALRERGATVLVAPRPGLATQYMDGVAFAVENGADRIVRHEPEKTEMVNFAPQISEALKLHDIVVIGRTERALQSLPPVQAMTEQAAGRLLEEHLDFPPDALSGGRGFTRRGAEYLAQYDVEGRGNTWLHLYDPVLAAMRDRVPVTGLAVDLVHPPEMTAEETGNPDFDKKRFDQFFMQMHALLPDLFPVLHLGK